MAAFAAIGLVLCGAVMAQEQMSTIQTEAEATVDSAPSHVEFRLQKTSTGESLAAAVSDAIAFEPALRKHIEERELSIRDLQFTSVGQPKLDAKQATVVARIRVSTAAYSASTDGAVELAQLCDSMLDLAKTLGATIEGPSFGVDNPETLEQSAVTRAVELAYPNAEAAASILRGQITAVDQVAILSSEWNKISDDIAVQPDIRRVTCTARVRVTYTLVPAAP